MKKLVSVFVLMFCLYKSQAQYVTGSVVDSVTKVPLIGVSILLAGTDKGWLTDQDGNFAVDLTGNSNKVLIISYLGYEKHITKPFVVDARNTVIFLKPSSNQLDQVVITAGKFEQNLKEVTVSMEVLKPSFITNNNSIKFDDAIDRVSGVNVLKGQLNIRGSSGFSYGAGSRVLIMVDDLPLLSADAGDAKWSYIPLENISQVEVIKGASSALFGSSALGGVVNIRTAYPGSKALTKVSTFGTYYGNPDAQHANVYGKNNPISIGLSAFHSQKFGNLDLSAGIYALRDDSYLVGDFSKRFRANVNTRYRSKIVGLSYGINANYMVDSSGNFLFWSNDTLAQLPDSGTNSRQLSHRFNIDPYVVYYSNPTTKHSLRTRVFNNRFESSNGDNAGSALYYAEYQFQKRFNWKYAKHTVLTAGAVEIFNDVKSRTLYGNKTSSNTAAYMQFDQKIGKLNYSVGARYERFVIDTDTPIYYPILRLGLNYQLFEATFLRASFGQGFRTPAIAERYAATSAGSINVIPNPELGREKGWSAEVGLKQGFKLGSLVGFADISGFRTYYEDMIEFVFGIYSGTLGFKAKNVTNAQITGVETNIGFVAKWGNIEPQLSLGYTYMNPVDLLYTPTLNEQAFAQYLKYRYKHLARADFSFKYKKLNFGVNLRFNSFMLRVDDVFENQIDGVRAYRERNNNGDIICDVRLNYALAKNISVGLVGRNVFNQSYTNIVANLGMPRSYVVQVNLSF